MASIKEPVLREININFSAGGKVAIVKFDETSDWHLSSSQRWEIPENWTQEQAQQFELEKYIELREMVDARSQIERDERFDQSFRA